jgi:phage gpG-like protein
MPQRNLPPRPFLVLTDEDREEVAQAIADALEER